MREEFLRSVDWFDLEQGISGDPADYFGHQRDMTLDEGTGYGAVIGCLPRPQILLRGPEPSRGTPKR